jgi:hypothetical protein
LSGGRKFYPSYRALHDNVEGFSSISCPEGDELIILDQHGAHERILYERLLKDQEGTPVALPSPMIARLPADLAPEV